MSRQPGEYQFYKNLRICVRCHKELAEPNKVFCLNCADKDNERAKRRRSDDLETFRKKDMDKYYNLKRQGICTYCKHEKADHGKTKCKKCLAKVRNKRNACKNDIARSERTAYGMCYICGRKNITGKKVCEQCYKTRLESINKIMYLPGSEHWARDNRVIFQKKNK